MIASEMKAKFIFLILMSILPLSGFGQSELLTFQEGEFKIMQLTDLHYIVDESFDAQNDSTLALIEQMIQVEKPQLIVLTGDVVVSHKCSEGWRRIADVFAQTKTPWMVTFGNHDTETDLSTQEIKELISSLPYSIMPKYDVDISGFGNLAIPVWDNKEIAWMLYFLDSHSYPIESSMGSYDWIKADQINWYRDERDKVEQKNKKIVPGIAFFHIPLPEFAAEGKWAKKVGNNMDGVCSPILNTGLFSAFLEKKDVIGVFCGHDHNNDYLLDFNGHIVLAYGRKTGYVSAYHEVLPRGVRVIKLNRKKRAFNTYLRDLQGVSHEYYFESKHNNFNY